MAAPVNIFFILAHPLKLHVMSNGIETGRTFSAAESIAYAAGSVVSKTIIKKPAGNVTLFSFAAGEGLAEHSSPHEAMVQILDGSAQISIAGQAQEVHAGECLILPANIPHALKAVQQFKMMLIMIKS